MKPCKLVLVLGVLGLTTAGLFPAAAEESPGITILEPDDGALVRRAHLEVAVRFDANSEPADSSVQAVRRLEFFLDDTLVDARAGKVEAGSTVHLTVPLRPRAPGPAVLSVLAWPDVRGAEPLEASVEIDVAPRSIRKDLANPDDDDDLDGLTNGDEVDVYGTDPTRPDSDLDGFWDGAEVEATSDPLASSSIPALTLLAPPPANVARRAALDFAAFDLNTAIARPQASVARRERPDFAAHTANLHLARPLVDVARREPINAATGTFVGRPPVRVEPAEAFAFLFVPERVPAVAGEHVTVPVELLADNAPVASVAFSIDYDADCLLFNRRDGDGDGLPDALTFDLPPGFVATAFVDLHDSDGEIDVFIFSNPVATLPSGRLANIDFKTTCVPPTEQRLEVPVAFSFDPRTSFGDVDGQDIPGAGVPGSVEIFGGLRGDCNSNGKVNAADLPALVLELFDNDGNLWLDTPGGTFPGDPVGCDANAETIVDAGDLSCTGRLIFSRPCVQSSRVAAGARPRLVLSERLLPSGNVLAEVRLERGAGLVASTVFSLDLDLERLDFDPRDADGDTVPDAVRFFAAGNWRSAVFDPSDSDGELDVVLTDLVTEPRPLQDGVLVEIELVPWVGTDGGVLFATDPAPSFGGTSGESVPADEPINPGGLFVDGFESGDSTHWSISTHQPKGDS